ncbi:MAG: T9SS type A sorting domain-containing protein [Bacteroidia bacterium]
MLRQVLISAMAMLTALLTLASNPAQVSKLNWNNAGNDNFFFHSQTTNFQNQYDCDYRGERYNDLVLQKAIEDLGEEGGVIHLKTGVYLFSQPILIPSNVLIKGEGMTTVLTFNMTEAKDAIIFNGTLTNEKYELKRFATKGESAITLASTAGISKGDLLKIWLPESELTTSEWAKGSISQIVKVKNVFGNTIELDSELRLNLETSETKIAKILPVKNAGISCLEIIRTDQTENQTSNITFNYAENCFVKGVQSDYSNFAHVEINNSYKVQVSGSFFRFGHDYGRGGKAYGVVLQFGSSDCLVENNIFHTLRHAVLLQAGANGNVVAYNYSKNPTWAEDNLPENSAGDLVLHGNYPFANLFEGNIAQNIVIDASHGKNGPNNVFLKNTAELYGFFINPEAADSQIIIDNKVPNKTFLLGNYLVFGEGHYEYGNKVRNKYVPVNTEQSEFESFYNKADKYTCTKDYRILAEARYEQKQYTQCVEEVELPDQPTINAAYTSVDDYSIDEISLYPNPTSDVVNIEYNGEITVTVYDIKGQETLITNAKAINVKDWTKGTYYFRIEDTENRLTTYKKVLVN